MARRNRQAKIARLNAGHYEPPEKAFKKLKTPLLDLFHIALLTFGPPRESVIQFVGFRRIGPQTWTDETAEGAEWGRFIQFHGDAKSRAGQIYRAWYGWHRKELRRDEQRRADKDSERNQRVCDGARMAGRSAGVRDMVERAHRRRDAQLARTWPEGTK